MLRPRFSKVHPQRRLQVVHGLRQRGLGDKHLLRRRRKIARVRRHEKIHQVLPVQVHQVLPFVDSFSPSPKSDTYECFAAKQSRNSTTIRNRRFTS